MAFGKTLGIRFWTDVQGREGRTCIEAELVELLDALDETGATTRTGAWSCVGIGHKTRPGMRAQPAQSHRASGVTGEVVCRL